MKKVFGILLLSLFLCSFAFAGSKSVARSDFYIQNASEMADNSLVRPEISGFPGLLEGLGILAVVLLVIIIVKKIFFKSVKKPSKKSRKKKR